MHRTAFTRAQRPRRTAAGHLRTRALKNWLSWHRTSGRGTHGAYGSVCLCHGRDRSRRRSFVHRARSRLGNNHARRRRLRRDRNRRGRSRTRRGHWRLRCGRCCNRRRWRCQISGKWRSRTRLCLNRWRSLSRRWSHGCSGLLNHGSDHFGPQGRRWRCNSRCRNRRRCRRRRWSRHWRRRYNGRLCRHRGRS